VELVPQREADRGKADGKLLRARGFFTYLEIALRLQSCRRTRPLGARGDDSIVALRRSSRAQNICECDSVPNHPRILHPSKVPCELRLKALYADMNPGEALALMRVLHASLDWARSRSQRAIEFRKERLDGMFLEPDGSSDPEAA